MIGERNILESKLEAVISSIYANKKVVDKFCTNMLNLHGVRFGTSADIIDRNTDIREVTKEKLLWITKELEDAVQADADTSYLASSLKLDKFFTDIEIKSLQNTKLSEELETTKFPIIIDKVIRVNDDQFVTAKGVEFVHDLRDKQVIRYNANTQREQTVKKTINGFRYVMTIIKKAVKQIRELMADNKFISNAITFNMNADEEVDYDYDEENMILTIFQATIDIIDGNHRYVSMTDEKDNNPDFKYNTIINIMHFTEEKAKRYIVQENKRNIIAKSKIKSLDIDNNGSVVANNLNESSKSNLRYLIGTTRGSLINFALFADIISFNFPMTVPQEIVKIKRYTINAFNALVDDNESLIKEKQPDLKWIFYVRVMKDYLETEDVDAFIEKIHKINALDFSKLDIKVNTIGKSLYKKVDKIISNI